MANQTIKVRIKHKYDTEANWAANNPVLLKGELAYSSDKGNIYKVGDGTSNWSSLAYNTIPWASVTGRPGSMKNPYALTLQFNGAAQTAYDGSAARTYNITPAAIGAAPASHTHGYLPTTGGSLTGNVTFTQDNQLFWNRNTDYFKLGFKNDSDADADSYAYVETGDNGNEYFRIQRKSGSTVSVIASFKAEGIRLSEGTFIGNLTGTANAATKATNDSAGQNINTTYIKGLSVNGRTITYTKGNGTNATITTQDQLVLQNSTTTANYRGLLLGYNNSTDKTTLDNAVTNQAYVCEEIYAQPSTGSLFAKMYSAAQSVKIGNCTLSYDTATSSLSFSF